MSELARVLLVDTDEFTISKLLTLFGQDAEFTVDHTGTAALHRFPHEHFDLALIDINLPDMSGVALCAALALVQPDLRRFLLSDGSAIEDLTENLDLCGAHGLLLRPIGTETIREELDRIAAEVTLVA